MGHGVTILHCLTVQAFCPVSLTCCRYAPTCGRRDFCRGTRAFANRGTRGAPSVVAILDGGLGEIEIANAALALAAAVGMASASAMSSFARSRNSNSGAGEGGINREDNDNDNSIRDGRGYSDSAEGLRNMQDGVPSGLFSSSDSESEYLIGTAVSDVDEPFMSGFEPGSAAAGVSDDDDPRRSVPSPPPSSSSSSSSSPWSSSSTFSSSASFGAASTSGSASTSPPPPPPPPSDLPPSASASLSAELLAFCRVQLDLCMRLLRTDASRLTVRGREGGGRTHAYTHAQRSLSHVLLLVGVRVPCAAVARSVVPQAEWCGSGQWWPGCSLTTGARAASPSASPGRLPAVPHTQVYALVLPFPPRPPLCPALPCVPRVPLSCTCAAPTASCQASWSSTAWLCASRMHSRRQQRALPPPRPLRTCTPTHRPRTRVQC